MSLADKVFTEGNVLYKGRDFDGAEAKFREALKIHPEHARSLLHLGLILQNQRKDFPATIQLWRAACINMTPNKHHVRICSSLAVLEDKVNNNYEEAERYYQQALQFDPNNTNVMVNYGLLLATRGVSEVGAGTRKHWYLNKDNPLETAQDLMRKAIKIDTALGRINNGGYLLQEILLKQGALRPVTKAGHVTKAGVDVKAPAAGAAAARVGTTPATPAHAKPKTGNTVTAPESPDQC
mmetsp:Transcript_51417/g.122419  ORF Transcript_51417/g.122419 Transcript_51417/m.122419 type:complete len:238 (+) Transcript_51417:78-791(+)